MITLDCPHCRRTIQADSDTLGKTILCPLCNQAFDVQLPRAKPFVDDKPIIPVETVPKPVAPPQTKQPMLPTWMLAVLSLLLTAGSMYAVWRYYQGKAPELATQNSVAWETLALDKPENTALWPAKLRVPQEIPGERFFQKGQGYRTTLSGTEIELRADWRKVDTRAIIDHTAEDFLSAELMRVTEGAQALVKNPLQFQQRNRRYEGVEWEQSTATAVTKGRVFYCVDPVGEAVYSLSIRVPVPVTERAARIVTKYLNGFVSE